MSDHSEAFVAFDTSKLRNAVAIADGGRGGEVRYLGEIENTGAATAKLVRKLALKYERLTFCYEAGPTGYGLHRLLKSLGHECVVVAPSLIPKKPGDRVKTNRRDALSLARQLRSDELTAVWIPDKGHEAMRDLTRAREAAVKELRTKRQQVSALLLRQGRPYPHAKKTWTKAHMSWLASQKFEYAEQRLVFEEMMLGMRQARERLERLEQAIRVAVPDWSLAEVVTALMALRGMDLISAATFLAEIGDLSRFQTPQELMAYLGRCHGRIRPETRSSAAASPRRVTGAHGACWSNAPGAISIPRGWDATNSRRLTPLRRRSARSPGRLSAACTRVTGRWSGGASSRPSPSPRWRGSSQASSGR